MKTRSMAEKARPSVAEWPKTRPYVETLVRLVNGPWTPQGKSAAQCWRRRWGLLVVVEGGRLVDGDEAKSLKRTLD